MNGAGGQAGGCVPILRPPRAVHTAAEAAPASLQVGLPTMA